MSKARYLVMLLAIFGIILVGCKDISKNENDVDNTSSSKTKNGINDSASTSKTRKKTGTYATINFDDGRTIEMVARSKQGILSLPSKFEANITDYKLIVMIEVKDSEPLQNKIYEKGAYLSISNMKSEIPLKESFGSNNTNKDGKRGEAKITFTTINNTRAEGTFSGTLYSKSHRKATIEGEFIIERQK
ncbi:hypothetical protein SAMN05444483_101646 [Salegentibacter echinorum]|uniref:Lipoprotein n=1 Tax=Salegentibacter echinorum TaxID=1073325 RepID=A0A1M5CTA8_SALEC|nr:hypothetical protein [Salegentibacter echinorum]SHF57582.1 hypothetical protein SAMN05444483_101646 [Salegentibacter echinorum]